MGRIDMSHLGYRSRAAFLRDPDPSTDIMVAMAMDEHWAVAKSVLLHPKCPMVVRDRFAQDPVWYKRMVAIFATKAPDGYIDRAAQDPDKRIQAAYQRYLKAKADELATREFES